MHTHTSCLGLKSKLHVRTKKMDLDGWGRRVTVPLPYVVTLKKSSSIDFYYLLCLYLDYRGGMVKAGLLGGCQDSGSGSNC